jgi:WD40 repeat protein
VLARADRIARRALLWAPPAALLVLVLSGAAAVAPPAAAAPPGNDNFLSAQVLAAGAGMVDSTTADATKEPGEPDHAGDAGGASVWFTWTPNFTGTAFVETAGSAIDTLLAVYQGSSFAGAQLIASNDEVGVGDSTSRVCFPVTTGSTFKVAVDGYFGAAGAVTLGWGEQSGSAPCATLPPTITGPATVGQVLTSTLGTFTPAGDTFGWQWARCAGGDCTLIGGATGASYTVTGRDVGMSLRLEVVNSAAGGSARNLSAPSPVVAMNTSTRKNGRIFFTDIYDTYSVLPDGTGTQLVSNFERSEATAPAPSPDGSRVAFVYHSPSGTTSLALMNADGSNPVDTGLYGIYPDWSPDGSRVVFLSYVDRGLSTEMFVGAMDADGSDAVILRSFAYPDSLEGVTLCPTRRSSSCPPTAAGR